MLIWDNNVSKILEDLESDNYFEECEITSDSDKWNIAQSMCDISFEDECLNLDVDLKKDIIAFAKLVRWDGIHSAYKEIKGTKISDCLRFAAGGESVRIYCENGELKADWLGHDNPVNPTVITFRVMKDGTDSMDKEDACEAFYSDAKNKWDIVNHFTEPLGNKVLAVYGWRA